jgi:hypothetical protein
VWLVYSPAVNKQSLPLQIQDARYNVVHRAMYCQYLRRGKIHVTRYTMPETTYSYSRATAVVITATTVLQGVLGFCGRSDPRNVGVLRCSAESFTAHRYIDLLTEKNITH